MDSRIRLVSLRCPYDNFEDIEVRTLFSDLMALKVKGYRKEYPYGVLPVDTSDFVANHEMVCLEDAGGLRPVMGYRSITSLRCHLHNLKFPLISFLEASNSECHLSAVENSLRKSRQDGKTISYDSSWTIDPDIRRDRTLTNELREIMKAAHVLYHLEQNTFEVFAGAVLRFKMERLYEYWGYAPLSLHNVELSSLRNQNLFDEEIQIFQLKKISTAALRHAELFRPLWKSRIVLGKDVFEQDSLEKNVA